MVARRSDLAAPVVRPDVITQDDLRSPEFRDQLSLLTGLACDPAEDQTRQEDAQAADINFILARHGVVPRPVVYGSFDFDLDLHSAYQAVSELRDGFARLPEDVRAKFSGWESVMQGLSSGELVFQDGKVVLKDPAPADGGSSAGDGSSASDSAPVS